MTGLIFDIQRFCLHDGPGIRTTVFLKGCPMRCAWCHNPEGIRREPHLSFAPDKCIGCGACFRVCPRGAHVDNHGEHVIDRTKCAVCGSCTAECLAGALEIIGREASIDEIIAEVAADRPFYDTSGGGMTLSGGEPLHQLDFTTGLLVRARELGIHCCMETCGHVPYEAFEQVAAHVDLFLYDIKEMDSTRHRAATGVSNDLILSNLRRLHDGGAWVRIRVPLVEGYNDSVVNRNALVKLAASLPRIEGVEVLPYHGLGLSKARRMGITHAADPEPRSPGSETLAQWINALRGAGVRVIDANWTTASADNS